MTRTQLITAIARSTRQPERTVGQIVKALEAEMAETLRRGENVVMPGFGTYAISALGERRGTNPRTGAVLTLPARRSVRFRASPVLAEQVNQ